ncbi:MAG: ABC transporter permease, partial [Rhodospirillaceae bacterium]|nr:ABC transporter permease [Rhodospirillaceae bacterium]
MRSVRTDLASTLREAVRSLLGARLRTLLGLIGIMIGIASVITMISIGEIAKSQSRKDFEALGTDIVTITPPDHLIGRPGRATIGLEDALALAEVLPSVSEAAPRIETQGSFRYA